MAVPRLPPLYPEVWVLMNTTPRSAIDGWGKTADPPAEPRQPGPVEMAVETDLKNLGQVGVGRVFMVESARKVARAIDARGDTEAPSSLAKAVDTLFKVMQALKAKDEGGQGDLGDLLGILGSVDAGSPAMSPPVRYPKEPRPADGRSGNRKGGKRPRPA